MDDLSRRAAGIGALAEPVRRDLYGYVVAQPDAVGREEAARGVGVPVHTAKFHLEKLVEEGLLDVEFRRLGGRQGPGAGRPSKLYRRSAQEFEVSLPTRRYDLVGEILATAFTKAGEGVDLDGAIRDSAAGAGRAAAQGAAPLGTSDQGQADLDRVSDVLALHGYEPRPEGEVLVLANCPFDSLAKQHTALVCGLNQVFVQGVADGLGCTEVEACLEPEEGQCCVKGRLRSQD